MEYSEDHRHWANSSNASDTRLVARDIPGFDYHCSFAIHGELLVLFSRNRRICAAMPWDVLTQFLPQEAELADVYVGYNSILELRVENIACIFASYISQYSI